MIATRRFASVVIAALLIAPSLLAADVQTGVLLPGTRFETAYYIIDSGKPGPLVMITGGVHGNEPAGYRAAEAIRHWPIVAGRMIVVPACNVPGLRANTRNIPGEPAGDPGNLNRLFPKTAAPNEATGEPAKTLWAFIQSHHPDWFIDLHEGFDYNITNSESVGSSVIHFGEDPKAARIAGMMADEVNKDIPEPGHRINLLARGPIDGSMARAAAQRLGIPGMICETTTKGPLEHRVGQHRIMMRLLLADLGLVTATLLELAAIEQAALPTDPPLILPEPKTKPAVQTSN